MVLFPTKCTLKKPGLSLRIQAGPNLDFDSISHEAQDKGQNRANAKLWLKGWAFLNDQF